MNFNMPVSIVTFEQGSIQIGKEKHDSLNLYACFECMFTPALNACFRPRHTCYCWQQLPENALDESYRITYIYFALASSGIAQAQPNRITSASDGQFGREEMLFLFLLHCQSLCYQARKVDGDFTQDFALMFDDINALVPKGAPSFYAAELAF